MRLLPAAFFLLQSAIVFGTDDGAGIEKGTLVRLETELGDITIAVDDERAPRSAASFLEYVDAGLYDGAAFYRVVSPHNDNGEPVISVVQGGIVDQAKMSEPVAHETTDQTGIRHFDGTVSLARGEPGTGSGAAFFICIGAQPALDFGGKRNADGLGFAAFGRVVDGMDVVRSIHSQEAKGETESRYLEGQILTQPIDIIRARRIPANQTLTPFPHVD